jgi:hypothetical protein
MKVVATLLAFFFLLLGLAYGLGYVNAFTSGAHSHHFTHLVVCWVLALLCLVWSRFQGAPARR